MPQYGYFLSRVMQPVSPAEGESGYFSAPEETLDPRLFEGDTMREDVRVWLLNNLYSFWSGRYRNAKQWSTVWLAGSGISYQWAAGRGNGDLDVLIGIDYPRFYAANPKYRGFSHADLSAIFNRELHEGLWPATANATIHEGTYEVTYYVNPNSSDIRSINPYAAYNLTSSEWTVRPPSGTDFEHPKEYFDLAQKEVDSAWELVERYNTVAAQAAAMPPGSPGWHNAMRQAELVSAQASTTYDQIHLGRKQAFGRGGSGYGDYHNFRWQYHKQHGTVQALHAVAGAHKDAQEAFSASLYGGPIDAADVALRRAALWNRGGNGR